MKKVRFKVFPFVSAVFDPKICLNFHFWISPKIVSVHENFKQIFIKLKVLGADKHVFSLTLNINCVFIFVKNDNNNLLFYPKMLSFCNL